MELMMQDLAYCGLYCPACSFRTANETGDLAHLNAVPERYARLKAMPLDELACAGCKGENICGDCEIKDCAVERGLEVCADCADFPCGKVETFGNDGMPHHRGALDALHAIKALGREKWFESIAPDLACESCGARQSWYYRCAAHKG